MGKIRRKLKRKNLLLFIICLSMLSFIFLIYVYKSMVLYERSLVDNYIVYLAQEGELSKGSNNLFEISSYEKKNAKINDGISKLFKNDNIKIKKDIKLSKDNIFVYNISYLDNIVSTVTLKKINTYTRMAILSIDEWEVVDIKNNFDKGIYHYNISIPSDYKLYINNNLVKIATDTVSIKGLERLSEHTDIKKNNLYEINNLVYEPNIEIRDESDKAIKYEINNNEIIVSNEFEKIASYDDAKERIKDNFDIMKFAENYSLFMTDDLSGYRHGFGVFEPHLINGTYMYEMMYGWATQVDITLVSTHYFRNPKFSNEMLSNFTFYNDDAFSCEVYLEKNMVVLGKDKVDKMHDELYFVYKDGNYKLVDMKSV